MPLKRSRSIVRIYIWPIYDVIVVIEDNHDNVCIHDIDYFECMGYLFYSETSLRSGLYAGELLASLHRLYLEDVCCDVQLIVGDTQVTAHRVVLVAGSKYLGSLLVDGKAAKDSCVNISGRPFIM